jgi:hypothetical protein
MLLMTYITTCWDYVAQYKGGSNDLCVRRDEVMNKNGIKNQTPSFVRP